MSSPRGLSDDLTWALRLVRLGTSRREIVAAISRKHPKHGYHSLVFGEEVARRGFGAAQRYAERTVNKAYAIAEEEPRVTNAYEARERLQVLYSKVDAEPWPLKLAGARRALEAAYVIGWERGRVAEMKLDLRTHAMRAGQSFGAIRHHRQQLHDLGWLRRHARDRGRGITRLSFHAPDSQHIEDPWGVLPCAADAVLAHDAWRPEGLGDAGWYLQHLIQRVQDSAPLACKGTWDDPLALLRAHGLGVPLSDAELLRRLDLASLDLGTFNTGYREGMGFLADRARRAAAHVSDGYVGSAHA